MRKNRNRPESDEPLSEGRVEYLEAARQRVRNRRIRRTAVLLVLLTAVVLFATGIAGSSVAALKDLTDTARIALLPGSGWPQQTGVAELEQMAPLTGSFVELGDEGCVVWSRTGKKLNSIQSGYAARRWPRARPALCSTTAPETSCGWRAAPRTSTPKNWKTRSSSAPCRTTARWLWSRRTRPAWQSCWYTAPPWSSSSAGA